MKEKEYRLKTLFWEATLRCNAFCEFCGSRCGEVSCNEISGEKIEKVFEDIADAYNPGSIMINVTGGEPILRKDLFEVMEKASDMGFPWGMVSNGSLIDKCIIQKMKQSGMKTISISLDGMEETHNRLRKIENGFQKTVQAIKDLKQAAFLNQIEVTTVVNHYNIEQLEEMYSMIKSFGIDSWRV
uniref:radical SAM protein n=1 Tax=Anaerobutyricum hallii TaxID=39488 RepID=UPI003FF0712B